MGPFPPYGKMRSKSRTQWRWWEAKLDRPVSEVRPKKDGERGEPRKGPRVQGSAGSREALVTEREAEGHRKVSTCV